MKCRTKHVLKLGGKTKRTIAKDQEGFIRSIVWGEMKNLYPEFESKSDGCFYLVDFLEVKGVILSTTDVSLI